MQSEDEDEEDIRSWVCLESDLLLEVTTVPQKKAKLEDDEDDNEDDEDERKKKKKMMMTRMMKMTRKLKKKFQWGNLYKIAQPKMHKNQAKIEKT